MSDNILQAIDGIETAIETQSTAETAAQNENFSDLIAAISALVLQTSVNVQSAICAPNIYMMCGAGPEGTGSSGPSEPITEGGPYPSDFEAPPVTGYDRKCRVANMSFDGVREVVYQFGLINIQNILILGVGAATSAAIAVLAVISGPIAVTVGIVGAVSAIVLLFLTESIDLGTLLTLLDDNKQDLVCSLYNAADSATAIDNFKSILSGVGANSAQIALIDIIFTIKAANFLYAKMQGSGGDSIEAQIDAYTTGSIDCATCATSCGDVPSLSSNYSREGDVVYLEPITVWSGYYGRDLYVVQIRWNSTSETDECGPPVMVSIGNVQGGSITPNPYETSFYYYDDDNVLIGSYNTHQTGLVHRKMYISSWTAYSSAEFTLTEGAY